MERITLERGLARLIDYLEEHKNEDPDRELVELSFAFCEARHVVPVGVRVPFLDFGTWMGPRMRTEDIKIHVKILRTGKEALASAEWWNSEWMDTHDTVTLSHVLVEL